MSDYDFSVQEQLFEIAYQILEDYGITDWTFGGGTALSYCYYQHRMSYDIDIFLEQFNSFDDLAFNQELKHLNSYIYKKKEGLADTINSIMIPNEIIKVAVDDVEVVAFDHFIDAYREFYEEVGSYEVFELNRDESMKLIGKDFITYSDVLGLSLDEIIKAKEGNK
ncbi:MAG TPA: hypothetical protein EYG73_11855 [Arcobacter sp.]|nr:hypothetical protein [Arcobacter sp.]